MSEVDPTWLLAHMFRTATAFMLMAVVAPVSAGIVTGYHFLPASAVTSINTPAPNNFNVGAASPNVIAIPTDYAGSTFNSIAPLTTVFFTQSSSGTSEYFLTERIKNNSGVDWDLLHISLSNIPSEPPFFDLTPLPTSSDPAVGILRVSSISGDNSLVYLKHNPVGQEQVVLPAGGTMELTFSIDVADLASPTFSIVHTPTPVPEPNSCAALLAFGIALSLGYVTNRFRPSLAPGCRNH